MLERYNFSILKTEVNINYKVHYFTNFFGFFTYIFHFSLEAILFQTMLNTICEYFFQLKFEFEFITL